MRKSLFFAICTLGIIACGNEEPIAEINLSNPIDLVRTNETVEISLEKLPSLKSTENELVAVVEKSGGKETIAQFMDKNGDGNADVLLFKADLNANGTANYSIIKKKQADTAGSKLYSRFVPERTDDYAWENDKVAFRTFGPTAQKMKEEGVKGGTLSSGIDCWLKRVDYPIINIWYARGVKERGAYHKDHGEGLDNFHVGSSRGCGGTGVYLDDSLYTSKNFTEYKTFANGPVRLKFWLNHADWSAKDLTIKEERTISLDLGENLNQVVVKSEGIDILTAGLTFHENDGETSYDSIAGWFSYWQPHGDDSELGTAIVCKPEYFAGVTKKVTSTKDQSQLLVHLKVIEGKTEYYTGFAWKKAGEISTKKEWESFLADFTKKINNPIAVVVK